jgi:hypothetical protein
MATTTHDHVRTCASLTREQVLALRRPAWAESEMGAQIFYFDGSHFWQLRQARPNAPAAMFVTPVDGWMHSPECGCAVCEAWRGL